MLFSCSGVTFTGCAAIWEALPPTGEHRNSSVWNTELCKIMISYRLKYNKYRNFTVPVYRASLIYSEILIKYKSYKSLLAQLIFISKKCFGTFHLIHETFTKMSLWNIKFVIFILVNILFSSKSNNNNKSNLIVLNFKIISIIIIIINCNPNDYFNVILIFNSLFWLCCAAMQTSTLNPEL